MSSPALNIALPALKALEPKLSENLAEYAGFVPLRLLPETYRLTINLFIQEHLFDLINHGGLSAEQVEALDRFHSIVKGHV